MTKAGDIASQIMSWIETNYYEEMSGLLVGDGYTCEPKTDPPWYTTNCPRATAMGLHNEALTRLLAKVEGDAYMGHLLKGTITFNLRRKFFSERDIARELSRAAKASGAPAKA